MKEVTLSPSETLLRESIIARINSGAQAICDQDVKNQGDIQSSIDADPLGLYTAIVAKLVSNETTTDELSNFINVGALVVARQMKAKHLLSAANKELEKVKADLEEMLIEPIEQGNGDINGAE